MVSLSILSCDCTGDSLVWPVINFNLLIKNKRMQTTDPGFISKENNYIGLHIFSWKEGVHSTGIPGKNTLKLLFPIIPSHIFQSSIERTKNWKKYAKMSCGNMINTLQKDPTIVCFIVAWFQVEIGFLA